HGHAEDLGEDPQVIVRTDAVAVGREQGDALRAIADRAARGDLRDRRRLADARGSDQCVDAAASDDVLGRLETLELADDRARAAVERLTRGGSLGDLLRQVAREPRAVTGCEQVARNAGTERLAPQRVAPGELSELVFEQSSQRRDFSEQSRAQPRVL